MRELGEVNLTLHSTGRTVKVGRYPTRDVLLKTYNVTDAEGNLIGRVSLDMATFEQRTPGRMYVNSRWQSPRWFYSVGDRFSRSRIFYGTRKEAITALLRSIAQDADAPAAREDEK